MPGRVVAITDPAFGDGWAGLEFHSRYGKLGDETVVVGVAREGAARAYPLPVLWLHEVVNDEVAAAPLLVTYCPVCRSGMVARRVVGGERTEFGASGMLWKPPGAASPSDGAATPFGLVPGNVSAAVDPARRRNLVLYDAATASLWSQLLATAICGPRRGDVLPAVPATTATWDEWREAHPETDVLLPPPHSTAENPPVPGR